MALTRWLDPNNAPNDLWTIADWTDTSLTVLMSHVWPSITDAVNERLAFSLRTQSSGFPANREFPDMEDSLITDDDVNLYDEMIWPEEVVEEANIQTSGTYSNPSSHPGLLTLSEFLQDVESYPSGNLLIYIDTAFQSKTALLQWAWAIQMYQALNYPKYYQRELKTTGSFAFPLIERQNLEILVTYEYNTSSGALVAATCTRNLNGTITDIYVANDLNESAPWSTSQEVKDYVVSQFDTEFAGLGDLDWVSITSDGNPYGSNYDHRIINAYGVNRIAYRCSAQIRRYRFQVDQEYRADNTRYDADQYVNYYYTGHNDTYQDFGTGKVDKDVEFVQLVADVNDNFVLEVPNPDYSNAGTGAPPAIPITPAVTIEENVGIFKEIIPAEGTVKVTIYARPNKVDGTGFEFYTP